MSTHDEQVQTTRPSHAGPVTFELARFAWATRDRLEIAGRWRGVEPGDIGLPELVVRQGGSTVRVPVLADDGPAPAAEEDWCVRFAWDGGPVPLDAPRLEFPDGKVVELPPLKPGRLRFGRGGFARPRRDPDADGPVSGRGAASAAPAASGDGAEAGGDVLAMRTRMFAVAEELEAVREELERAGEETERARREAARAARRRAADADRFRADLEKTRALAQKLVQEERHAREQAERTLAATQAELEAARAGERRLRDMLETVQSELEDLGEPAEPAA